MSTWKNLTKDPKPKKADDIPDKISVPQSNFKREKKTTDQVFQQCPCGCNCEYHESNHVEKGKETLNVAKHSTKNSANPLPEEFAGTEGLDDEDYCSYQRIKENKRFFRKWLQGISESSESSENAFMEDKHPEQKKIPNQCSVQNCVSTDISYQNKPFPSSSKTALPPNYRNPQHESSDKNKPFPQKCHTTNNRNLELTGREQASPSICKNPKNSSYKNKTVSSNPRCPSIISSSDAKSPANCVNPNVDFMCNENRCSSLRTNNTNSLYYDKPSSSHNNPTYNLPPPEIKDKDSLCSTRPSPQKKQNIDSCDDKRPASYFYNHPVQDKQVCGCYGYTKQDTETDKINVPIPSSTGNTITLCCPRDTIREDLSLLYCRPLDSSPGTSFPNEQHGNLHSSPNEEKEPLPYIEQNLEWVIKETGKYYSGIQHDFSPCCLARTTKECQNKDQQDTRPCIPTSVTKYGKYQREYDDQQPSTSSIQKPESSRSRAKLANGCAENTTDANGKAFANYKDTNLPEITVKVYFQSLTEETDSHQRPDTCCHSHVQQDCSECYQQKFKVEENYYVQNVCPERQVNSLSCKENRQTSKVQPLHQECLPASIIMQNPEINFSKRKYSQKCSVTRLPSSSAVPENVRQNIPQPLPTSQECLLGYEKRRQKPVKHPSNRKCLQKCSMGRLSSSSSSTDLQLGKSYVKEDSKISLYQNVNPNRSKSTGMLPEDNCNCIRCNTFHAAGHRIGTSSSEGIALQDNIEWRSPPILRNTVSAQSIGKKITSTSVISSQLSHIQRTDESTTKVLLRRTSSNVAYSMSVDVDSIQAYNCDVCNKFHNQGHKLRICRSESNEDTYEFSNLGWYAVERYRKKCPELDPNCAKCKQFHIGRHCEQYEATQTPSSDNTEEKK